MPIRFLGACLKICVMEPGFEALPRLRAQARRNRRVGTAFTEDERERIMAVLPREARGAAAGRRPIRRST